jgi:hypothetical protein
MKSGTSTLQIFQASTCQEYDGSLSTGAIAGIVVACVVVLLVVLILIAAFSIPKLREAIFPYERSS